MSPPKRRLGMVAQVTAVIAGVAAGALIDVAHMKAVASELIAALSIAAGIVAQGMVLIATMFQPGRLTPERVRRVTAELEKQLRLAGELFFVLALAIVPLVMLKGEIDAPFISARVGLIFLGFVGGIAVARLYAFFSTLMALQRLRHVQFTDEAMAEEAAARTRLMERVAIIPARANAPIYGGSVPTGDVQSAEGSPRREGG